MDGTTDQAEPANGKPEKVDRELSGLTNQPNEEVKLETVSTARRWLVRVKSIVGVASGVRPFHGAVLSLVRFCRRERP